MLLTGQEMKVLERRLFADGVSPEALMDEAGWGMALAIRQFFPEPGTCVVYAGRGHNGGDAWVAARHLAEAGWLVQQRPVFAESQLSELTLKKMREAGGVCPNRSHRSYETYKSYRTDGICAPQAQGGLVFLDGLLGIGAAGSLRDPIRQVTTEINRLREQFHAYTFAVDLPTGLDADTGVADPDCVVADFTLAVGCAKAGLVADSAINYVGRLAVVPLQELNGLVCHRLNEGAVAVPSLLAPLISRLKFNTHKTQCGRVAVVAGSPGMTGAALMCAKAAVRAGAGLVTLFATRETYPILAAGAMPEIMVRPVDSYREVLETERDVIAIGPGLGKSRRDEVLHLLKVCSNPMVVDADALNALSGNTGLLHDCAGTRLLTPHPGEMGRMMDVGALSRSETVSAFTRECPVPLLLKGSRTVIGEAGRPLSYNSTGSPGMATGGMGDILTGVCAAMLARGLSAYDGARIGAWLCGRAAELAIYNGTASEESLAAADLTGWFGTAFKELYKQCF